MTQTEILAKLELESRAFPPKLRQMVMRYMDACGEGVHTPAKLMRHGQRLLNATFVKADEGDVETQQAMIRDHINAMTLATAAELFGTTADALEAL